MQQSLLLLLDAGFHVRQVLRHRRLLHQSLTLCCIQALCRYQEPNTKKHSNKWRSKCKHDLVSCHRWRKAINICRSDDLSVINRGVYFCSKASWYICRSESILSRDLSKVRSTASPLRSFSMSISSPSTVRVCTRVFKAMWWRNRSRPMSLENNNNKLYYVFNACLISFL